MLVGAIVVGGSILSTPAKSPSNAAGQQDNSHRTEVESGPPLNPTQQRFVPIARDLGFQGTPQPKGSQQVRFAWRDGEACVLELHSFGRDAGSILKVSDATDITNDKDLRSFILDTIPTSQDVTEAFDYLGCSRQ